MCAAASEVMAIILLQLAFNIESLSQEEILEHGFARFQDFHRELLWGLRGPSADHMVDALKLPCEIQSIARGMQKYIDKTEDVVVCVQTIERLLRRQLR